MRIAALIVAAGRGTRAAAQGSGPKQYAAIGGRAVLTRAIDAFARHPEVDEIKVVIHPDDADLYQNATEGCGSGKLSAAATGGASRQASVLRGLEALSAAAPDVVLIHDAARPFVSAKTISNVIAALQERPAALAALPVTDTLKRTASDGLVTETVARAGLWRAQTPQGFHFAPILDAHRAATAKGLDTFTDDAAIAEWAGLEVAVVEDSIGNIKITTAEDLELADRQMTISQMTSAREPRTGTGFDVHRFTDGDHVWLGGVKIPHTHKLEGHSDADVVLHALTDALLGAIGDGDIGQHFPPSDPKWKGAASILFLEDAARRVRETGGQIGNVDITVLAEAPRIGPHRPAMQELIGGALGLPPNRVGIKATTMECMGFVGRREGIAAMATATVFVPAEGK
ncbi:bifunctional 2-C-methyl-D-erythritol 4-phosphate cytidylyltransferase/2-C-methyl-D-erythritol 2,4-cyclodiphosphate synthase [Hyphomicrobium sp.]|uniref:bifunctional 2-C-methyl-D-erythritol 4-phosphate cytidylyltransferase/2-C-methyl-D-erythritol 2,4-cyclodiphosphate synthase n=1 Tax=Hyphomicrobium sp. TaxID=82 RepID=UPI000FADF54F|nr:bifunctional 2-C-methyl-D-erythritol 4-phosphate cytidylyltransferase/2-C-methyl-D-erythritol 2,4-cyclodiphosphate synthase [Hyphomicrobium sp.]RUP10944.1 MAG: bifunctional 2-C-methyl-D-erythritol 4-phosphate cytidylyltransferase/2-C-methyl-D-erythritol 2,4-cyclodiphosphate synthase [Hyphomicrobium sp.]